MEIDAQYAVSILVPNTSFKQVFLEAIANALDAGATVARIKIETDGRIDPEYLSVTISDNGSGFTDERFEYFRRLQTPKDQYHKGLGRLIYLEYFTTVDIVSYFGGYQRAFKFTKDFDGKAPKAKAKEIHPAGTTLTFREFRKQRLRAHDDVYPEAIKAALLEEFLPQLLSRKAMGTDFQVTIELETGKRKRQRDFVQTVATLSVADIPKFKSREFTDGDLGAFTSVHMRYVIRDDDGDGSIRTYVSVDGRAVPFNLLKSDPLPVGKSGIVFFESELFTGKTDGSRQRLQLSEEVGEATVRRVLRRHLATILQAEVPEVGTRNGKTKEHFEKTFPHLLGLFDSDTVGLIDREDALHDAQERFFLKQKEVLEGSALDDQVFRESLDLSARTLAEYILYRQIIIQRLQNTPPKDHEKTVHDLIVPQYQTFQSGRLVEGIYANNAWLLDDRFMTYRTVLSEAEMEDVIKAIRLRNDPVDVSGRPDISLIFSADPDDVEKVDVVVVELKKRDVNEKEGFYAINQLTDRARKLIKHCPKIQRVWYFAVIEFDDDLEVQLRTFHWKPMYSKGKVYYQEFPVEDVLVPIFLLSWDALVEDAAARNHMFLEILRADIKKSLKERPSLEAIPTEIPIPPASHGAEGGPAPAA